AAGRKSIRATLAHIVVHPSSVSESEIVLEEEVDKALDRKVLRKVGLWLLGFYLILGLTSSESSTRPANYSNAAIINLEHGTSIKKQLQYTSTRSGGHGQHLDPSQWAWTLFVCYMIFEPMNTVPPKTFGPSAMDGCPS
ncbi:hypothetical protein A1O7_01778, partial [Cladophialophora yegresii CBS 114405]